MKYSKETQTRKQEIHIKDETNMENKVFLVCLILVIPPTIVGVGPANDSIGVLTTCATS